MGLGPHNLHYIASGALPIELRAVGHSERGRTSSLHHVMVVFYPIKLLNDIDCYAITNSVLWAMRYWRWASTLDALRSSSMAVAVARFLSKAYCM